jgi:hypothetical protein
MFPWVRFTPLGFPVVPEVYMIKQRWSLSVVRGMDQFGEEGLVGHVWLGNLRGFDQIHPSTRSRVMRRREEESSHLL